MQACTAVIYCLNVGKITVWPNPTVASPGFVARRGKIEITSRGSHGGLRGRLQQLFDD